MVVHLQAKQVSRRIRELRERTGLNRYAWARQLGMTVRQVGNYETDRIPDPAFLARIAEAAGVSVDWILTGESTSEAGRRQASQPTLIFSPSLQEAPETFEQAQYVIVPILTRAAAVGRSRAVQRGDVKGWLCIDRAEIRARTHHRLVAVEMIGDSMEPIIRAGAIATIDLDDKRIIKRGIYAIATPDGEWTIKHVKQSEEGLVLFPANSTTDDPYPAHIDLKRHPEPIVGRAIYVWQRLT
jgi:phage repressor protein C with HTH and peptisase S24 domain